MDSVQQWFVSLHLDAESMNNTDYVLHLTLKHYFTFARVESVPANFIIQNLIPKTRSLYNPKTLLYCDTNDICVILNIWFLVLFIPDSYFSPIRDNTLLYKEKSWVS